MPTRSKKLLSEDERAARRAADRELMAHAVDALMTSEGWRRWLSVRRHFHAYSVQNQLLIALQCPHATHVAGFRAWLKLGYVVRKGERGLRIWAPMPPSRKAMQSWRDAGAVPADRPRTHFRMTAVFDRSQVNEVHGFPGGAAPLTPPSMALTGDDLADRWPVLVRLSASVGSPVTVESIPGASDGFYAIRTKRIVIAEGLAGNARVSTLVHELAHALVAVEAKSEGPALTYAQEEVVAETVAFTVCSGLGFDTGGESIPYVAGYATAAGVDAVHAQAALIDRLAKRIEDALQPANG